MANLLTVDDVFQFIQPFILTVDKWNDLQTNIQQFKETLMVEQPQVLNDNKDSSIDSNNDNAKHHVILENNDNIVIKIKNNENKDNENKENKKFPTNEKYSIIPQNTIFWYMYENSNNKEKHMFIQQTQTKTMIDEKQKIMDYLKTNDNIVKPFMKKNKMTGIWMKEIQSDLSLNKPELEKYHFKEKNNASNSNGFFVKNDDFKLLLVYCLYYNITLFCIHKTKNMWFSFNDADAEMDCNIINNDNIRLTMQFSICEIKEPNIKIYKFIPFESTDNFKEEYYKIDNIQKPLLSITNYKLNELKQIAISLGLKTETENIKKNEIYDYLCNYFIS